MTDQMTTGGMVAILAIIGLTYTVVRARRAVHTISARWRYDIPRLLEDQDLKPDNPVFDQELAPGTDFHQWEKES